MTCVDFFVGFLGVVGLLELLVCWSCWFVGVVGLLELLVCWFVGVVGLLELLVFLNAMIFVTTLQDDQRYSVFLDAFLTTLCSPNEDFGSPTNVWEQVFEMLFKGASTQFGLRSFEK